MLPNIGMPELLVVLLIILLVFGAKRLPEMGASMGKGIREFKKSIKEVQETIDESDDSATQRRIDAPAASDGEPKKLSE